MRFNTPGCELQHMMHGRGKLPLLQGCWHLARHQEDCGYPFAWSCNVQKPQVSVTAAAQFCISNYHELQICFSELFQPALFLKNTNASNFVENGQLTWLTQTWMDYWSSAELFFWDKNSSAGMKAFICQTLLQLKWRTCAISSWTHAYLHQPKEPSVQKVHMWALLICQHLWE